MGRTISNALMRYVHGRGLGSGWEEYQYMDALAAATGDTTWTSDAYYGATLPSYSTSNDVGTGWASSLWDTIAGLGTTYLQGQTQEAITKQVASTVRPGTTVATSPTGALTVSSAPLTPLVYTSQGSTFDTLLKNPLVWAAVAAVVILPPLLRKPARR